MVMYKNKCSIFLFFIFIFVYNAKIHTFMWWETTYGIYAIDGFDHKHLCSRESENNFAYKIFSSLNYSFLYLFYFIDFAFN
jgi:hypothetical protein